MPDAAFQNQPLLTPEQLHARLDEFERAVDEFNHGWYFESHETLEDLWMVTPWPERQFFQGIIQLAAAFVHYARREYAGIFKLLDAASDKLREFEPEQFGVDVTSLLEDIARARGELEALGADRFLEWDERRRPVIRYVEDGAR
jgi:predicted metal-dependent hydrolase